MTDDEMVERYAEAIERGRKMGRAEMKDLVVEWLCAKTRDRADIRSAIPVSVRRSIVNGLFDRDRGVG